MKHEINEFPSILFSDDGHNWTQHMSINEIRETFSDIEFKGEGIYVTETDTVMIIDTKNEHIGTKIEGKNYYVKVWNSSNAVSNLQKKINLNVWTK